MIPLARPQDYTTKRRARQGRGRGTGYQPVLHPGAAEEHRVTEQARAGGRAQAIGHPFLSSSVVVALAAGEQGRAKVGANSEAGAQQIERGKVGLDKPTIERGESVMIFVALGRWSNAAGRWFIRERIYRRGYRWTPFVRVRWRYEFAMHIAWWLPRRIIAWALIRAWTHATTGRWEREIVSTLTASEMIKRWEIKTERVQNEEKAQGK